MFKKITSLQNPFIKQVIQLQEKSRTRKKENLFVVEGKRELTLALQNHFVLQTLLFVPEIFSLANQINAKEIIEITSDVFEKIAYRGSTEGVIGIFQTKSLLLEVVILPENPLVLLMESIEKPGNVGAMLRTADAAKVDLVIIANPKTDLYNPNIIRSSVGGIFTNQIVVASNEEIATFLHQKKIPVYAATMQNSNRYNENNYTTPCCFAVGTEDIGLSDFWRNHAKQNIYIPMLGQVDSMNVSVAAAILLYEAKRQRSFL
jgi:TrmH family RNA methyltransferase